MASSSRSRGRKLDGGTLDIEIDDEGGDRAGSGDTDEDNNSSAESEPEKTLAATRTRRANAGNRMQALTNDELLQDDAYKEIYGGFTELENDEEYDTDKHESRDDRSESGESYISYEQTSSEDESTKETVEKDSNDTKRQGKKNRELVAASNARRAFVNKQEADAAAAGGEPLPKRRRIASKRQRSLSSIADVVKPVRSLSPRRAAPIEADTENEPPAASSPTFSGAAAEATNSTKAKLLEILHESSDALRRSARWATQLKSIETQERLFEERAARHAKPKKTVQKQRPLTQDELMALAALREEASKKWLEERRLNALEKEKEQKKVRRKVKFQQQCIKFVTRLRASDEINHVSAGNSRARAGMNDDAGVSNAPANISDQQIADASTTRVRTRRGAASRKNAEQPPAAAPHLTTPVDDIMTVTFGFDSHYEFPSKIAMDQFFAPFIGTVYPEVKPKCPVTGNTARYVDPLTRTPYWDSASLIVIRDAFVKHVQANFPPDREDVRRLMEWYQVWHAEHTKQKQ